MARGEAVRGRPSRRCACNRRIRRGASSKGSHPLIGRRSRHVGDAACSAPPVYQAIVDTQIPSVALPTGGGSVRVIAGAFEGVKGAARTIRVLDLRLAGDERTDLPMSDGYTTALVVLREELRVNGSEAIREAEVGLFDRAGESICIDGARDAVALVLCGEPIDEPVVGQGPFVMNTREEIRQAVVDYQSGRIGHLG